jgi:hypothetical protein
MWNESPGCIVGPKMKFEDLTPNPPLLLPLASELQGALVRRDGVEPFGRGFPLSQGSGNSEFRIGRRPTSLVIKDIQSANCEL